MNEKANISVPALRAGGALAAINPQTYDEVVRLAKMAVLSGFSCKGKNDDDDVALAKATMAILHGLECGIPAVQAVQGIAIINGKPMMYGDLLTALLWSKGFKIKKWIEGTGDDRVGHARITRPDGEVIEKSFSVAQAKRAQLWDAREKVRRKWDGEWKEVPNDSPWFRFDERMLEWRAFGFCVKDGASDATHGMLVREEADPDFNRMVDITPQGENAPAPKTLDIPDDDVVTDEGVSPSHHADASEKPDTPSDASADQETEDEPIVDPELFVSQLEDAIALCDSAEELKEVADANAGAIKRLPKALRVKAAKLIKDRMDE